MPAAAGAFSIRPGGSSEQATIITAADSPLFQPMHHSPPTHSSRLRSRLMLRRRNKSDSQYKLQAYTLAPDESRSNPWFNFLNFRDSVADYADSLFSLEGGEAATPKAATRPYMPNLEVEERLTFSSTASAAAAATAAVTSTVAAATTTTELNKDELLMELNSLSVTFDELQCRYEATIDSLKDENSFLEEGIKMLTLTIEDQAEQIEQLQKQNTLGELLGEEEESDLDGIGAIFDNKVTAEADELIQVQNKVTTLESDNEMLRQRVRSLEVALSDVAFESRKVVPTAAAVEAPAAVVAMEVVAPVANVAAASTEEVTDVVVQQVKVAPHAPSTPIPKHLLQKQEMDMLRMQIQEYEVERKSVRKLFGMGIRRGVKKVGKALNLWRPIYLILCDGVRGDGKMAL
jgi:hypothetical protein